LVHDLYDPTQGESSNRRHHLDHYPRPHHLGEDQLWRCYHHRQQGQTNERDESCHQQQLRSLKAAQQLTVPQLVQELQQALPGSQRVDHLSDHGDGEGRMR